MTYKEASKILNINQNRIRNLIKENKLKLDSQLGKKIDPDSVYAYKKELDIRRSYNKPVWVPTGGNII